jgi:hypothetical protein
MQEELTILSFRTGNPKSLLIRPMGLDQRTLLALVRFSSRTKLTGKAASAISQPSWQSESVYQFALRVIDTQPGSEGSRNRRPPKYALSQRASVVRERTAMQARPKTSVIKKGDYVQVI